VLAHDEGVQALVLGKQLAALDGILAGIAAALWVPPLPPPPRGLAHTRRPPQQPAWPGLAAAAAVPPPSPAAAVALCKQAAPLARQQP
jgi:hypothetical protein